MLLTAAGATGHPVTIAGCSGRGTRTADAAGHEQIIGDQAVCVSEKAAQQLPLRRKHTGRIMEDYAFLCIYASRRNALISADEDVCPKAWRCMNMRPDGGCSRVATRTAVRPAARGGLDNRADL